MKCLFTKYEVPNTNDADNYYVLRQYPTNKNGNLSQLSIVTQMHTVYGPGYMIYAIQNLVTWVIKE